MYGGLVVLFRMEAAVDVSPSFQAVAPALGHPPLSDNGSVCAAGEVRRAHPRGSAVPPSEESLGDYLSFIMGGSDPDRW